MFLYIITLKEGGAQPPPEQRDSSPAGCVGGWSGLGRGGVAGRCFRNAVGQRWGGHFLEGRCSVVLAYDYLQGRDFGELHVSWCTRMEAVSAENGEAVSPALGQLRPEQIDFRRYSRHLNPEKPSYDFRVDAVQEHKSGASLESHMVGLKWGRPRLSPECGPLHLVMRWGVPDR